MRKVNEELTKFIFDHGYRNQLVIDKLKKMSEKYTNINFDEFRNCTPSLLDSWAYNRDYCTNPMRDTPLFHHIYLSAPRLVTVWLFDQYIDGFEEYKLKAYNHGCKIACDRKLQDQYHVHNCKSVIVLIYAINDFVDRERKEVYKHDFIDDARIRCSTHIGPHYESFNY